VIFETPWLLFLAPLGALAAAAGVWLAWRRRVALAAAWSPTLARVARTRGRWGPAALGMVTLLALVALAGPRGGRASVTTETRALSMVLAIDISRSMLAEDVRPNRLQRAVREARRLVQDSPGDRVGLIAFAGRSYILAPLTVDGSAVQMYLDVMDPELASQGGTSLAAALAQGGQLLAGSGEVGDRVLVLMTDGETHDSVGEAVAAARELREQSVRLVIVAEGGAAPVRIPVRDSAGTLLEYKLDENGAVVQTRREDDVLSALAEAGDGTIVGADVPDQAGAVKALLATFKRSPSAETRVSDFLPRGWIPLLAAGVLLLLYTITRRGAALLVLAALAAPPGGAAAQRPSAGDRAMAAGRPGDAAAEYLEQAGEGAARDTAFYNAGAAALEAQRFDVARGALAEAAKSLDPGLRYRALYNLGVANLLAARADSSKREQLLAEASDRLREALLLEPASERAKWNLELAERLRPPPPPASGGGGGGGGGGSQRPEPPPPASSVDQRQADQILNSMEREERATRAEQQRRTQGTASGVKDW
jgi:Ca-activated chloride channel family protein